ncbi:MAG TPA: carbohydrate porin [Kofleriaceae bacterium]|nr:carbohydrate porin [Kofleriaceae bacterium]
MRKMIAEEVAKGKPKGPAIEFSGYARAGVGLAVHGGKQVCFGLAGADTKWRLGNECDYVIEPQFTGRLVQLQDKSSWGVVVMPGLYRTWEDPNGADKTFFDNIPAVFRQIYFFGENIPQLLNGRVWGGKRYYDRLHLDINDQFLEIEDGDGAGVEDMQIGKGKLTVAFLMNPNSEANQVPNPMTGGPAISTANLAPFKLTARYTDIPTVPDGALQIWAAWYGSSTSKDQADAGVDIQKPDNLFRVAAYHTLNKVLGGSNFVGTKAEFGSNHLLWRGVVQEQMLFDHGHTGLDVIAEYRYARNRLNSDAPWVTNQWMSLGARGDTLISGPFRFLAEAGIDRVSPDSGDAPLLFKATACLALNAGDGPGSRPTFRLFYTHGFWNDAAAASALGVYALGQSGKRLAQVYGDANNGGSIGIQAEAWW